MKTELAGDWEAMDTLGGKLINCELIGMLTTRIPPCLSVEFVYVYASDVAPRWYVRIGGVPMEIRRVGEWEVRVTSDDFLCYMPHNETAVLVEKALRLNGGKPLDGC